ncbi:MarR family winged helix-turn-helix transcriptional regulator [Fodinicola feengrottensis]|uniref:MarR family winged helix-turn-helix transcriptional regulator n=1 Tax=Fodinicola feengrottensis TaxID=435914 RepID=UPI0024412206|nr:MarR family transcriptional regulator [Fodinicola feengrottensis]
MREGPQTASQLGARLHLTRGSMTTLVDRLERAGYATRHDDPQHGRRKTGRTHREARRRDHPAAGPPPPARRSPPAQVRRRRAAARTRLPADHPRGAGRRRRVHPGNVERGRQPASSLTRLGGQQNSDITRTPVGSGMNLTRL